MTYIIVFAAGYVTCLFQSYILGWIKAAWNKVSGNIPQPPA